MWSELILKQNERLPFVEKINICCDFSNSILVAPKLSIYSIPLNLFACSGQFLCADSGQNSSPVDVPRIFNRTSAKVPESYCRRKPHRIIIVCFCEKLVPRRFISHRDDPPAPSIIIIYGPTSSIRFCLCCPCRFTDSGRGRPDPIFREI